MTIKVLDTNGFLKEFDEDKIVADAKAAGLTISQAETLAINITQWILTCGLTQISATEIKSKFTEEVQNMNAPAFNPSLSQ